MADVEWRVATNIGPDGNVRERHAYRDLSGQIAQAVCEQTVFTERLEPDSDAVRACPLCVLFVGVALADQQQGDERWSSGG
jgi:hypothetical protein